MRPKYTILTRRSGTFTYTPIHYLYKSIKPEELCALYAIADVCIISSLRDGLNMVSYEYVACQTERKGVLMMSSYAGAAKTLPECMILNPWDTPRFADKMARALEMPMDERERRQSANSKVVDSWTRSVLRSLCVEPKLRLTRGSTVSTGACRS